MILLDSNILIYLHHPDYASRIAEQLAGQRLATCNIIVAEVLGYGELKPADYKAYQALLSSMRNYAFDELVTAYAIEIRQTTSLQLPDAIIAATASAHGIPLWTHNTADFKKVRGLQLFDPLAN